MNRSSAFLLISLFLLASALLLTHCGESGAPPEPGGPAALTLQEPIPPGDPNCPYGGVRIWYGIDDNGNGVLDPAERDGSEAVCHGAPGVNSLIAITPEPIGPNCSGGGYRIDAGLDDDRDGVLDPGEIDQTSYLCNIGGATDADGDLYPAAIDCDDGNAAVHPGASEVCDGLDNNCDAVVDEGFPKAVAFGTLACTAGTPQLICVPGYYNCAGNPENGCESLTTCPVDQDQDGYPAGDDCDDGNSAVHPNASEACNNVDDNCDGFVDESLTRACGSAIGVCTEGLETCSAGVWGGCTGTTGGPEVCNNQDDNCNGTVDEGLSQIILNGSVDCVGGILMVSCEPGWTDCNQQIGDGCEADLQVDVQNCGACGEICAQGEACMSGQCVPP